MRFGMKFSTAIFFTFCDVYISSNYSYLVFLYGISIRYKAKVMPARRVLVVNGGLSARITGWILPGFVLVIFSSISFYNAPDGIIYAAGRV